MNTSELPRLINSRREKKQPPHICTHFDRSSGFCFQQEEEEEETKCRESC